QRQVTTGDRSNRRAGNRVDGADQVSERLVRTDRAAVEEGDVRRTGTADGNRLAVDGDRLAREAECAGRVIGRAVEQGRAGRGDRGGGRAFGDAARREAREAEARCGRRRIVRDRDGVGQVGRGELQVVAGERRNGTAERRVDRRDEIGAHAGRAVEIDTLDVTSRRVGATGARVVERDRLGRRTDGDVERVACREARGRQRAADVRARAKR